MPIGRKDSPEHAAQLEAQLDARDLHQRLRALRELKHLADAGAVSVASPRPWVNMHCHSFHLSLIHI